MTTGNTSVVLVLKSGGIALLCPLARNPFLRQQAPLTTVSQQQTWRQHSSGHWQHVGGVSLEIRRNPTAVHIVAEAVSMATGTLNNGLTAPNLVRAANFYPANKMVAKVFEFRKKILVQISILLFFLFFFYSCTCNALLLYYTNVFLVK